MLGVCYKVRPRFAQRSKYCQTKFLPTWHLSHTHTWTSKFITVHDTILQNLIQEDQHAQRQIAPTAIALIRPMNAYSSTILLTTNSSSKYFDTAIWSPSPFRRRVFNTRSLANACPEAGSRGRSLMLVSVGSPALLLSLRGVSNMHADPPGTIDQ